MAKSNSTKKIIPAVAYCRKSTNEEFAEKSIADQRERIAKLTHPDPDTEYKIVRWYARDMGVPGWKRGASRPDFDRLVRELKETGAKAILCDDADRFSRADEMEVMHDVQELKEYHGIRFIHMVNQGLLDLVHDHFATMKLAMSAMASHEHCTRLSRRIAHARLDKAKKGLRTGGPAPYGLQLADAQGNPVSAGKHKTGEGGCTLIPGDKTAVKWVKWIFDQFVNRLKSMHWITEELNRLGVPARHGGCWYVSTIRQLLQRREYRGDFSYNAKKSGQFHIVNSKFEVVPTSQYHDNRPNPYEATTDGLVLQENRYKPLIDPKLFDAAQKRLATFSALGRRKPRVDGYPLSRILVCDHCGRPMFGCQPSSYRREKGKNGKKIRVTRNFRVYRCSNPDRKGPNACGALHVHEELILPYVLKLMSEEIKDMTKMLTAPPKELLPTRKREQRKEAEQQRATLAKKIETYNDRILDIEDKDTRQALDRKISAMRIELAKLDAELADERSSDGWSSEQVEAITRWWEDFEERAVSVPVQGNIHPVIESFHRDRFSDIPAVLLDARVVNEALHALGCEVRLHWKTEKVMRGGKQENKYTLEKGRFRLGQRNGEIPLKKAVRQYSAPLAVVYCHGNTCGNLGGKFTFPGALHREGGEFLASNFAVWRWYWPVPTCRYDSRSDRWPGL